MPWPSSTLSTLLPLRCWLLRTRCWGVAWLGSRQGPSPPVPPLHQSLWPGRKRAGLSAFVFCGEPTAARAGKALVQVVCAQGQPASRGALSWPGWGQSRGQQGRREDRGLSPTLSLRGRSPLWDGEGPGAGWGGRGSWEAAGSPWAPGQARSTPGQIRSLPSGNSKQPLAASSSGCQRRRSESAGEPSSFLHVCPTASWTLTREGSLVCPHLPGHPPFWLCLPSVQALVGGSAGRHFAALAKSGRGSARRGESR